MEKKLCHNCLGDMYPDGNGWKCRACGVCMDADGRHYMPAPPPLTNADRIRGMSDEELAEFISMKYLCHMCTIGTKRNNREDEPCNPEWCIEGVVKWLRQPVQPMPDVPDTHEHSGLLEE
ncbi:MAG: hypothetical protein J6B95_08310 [Oscillospiraceae bacterium]|nr:hypothetical protein [Oscillospiraceae bacterium]